MGNHSQWGEGFCVRSPFFNSVDWDGALAQAASDEIAEFGDVGEPASIKRLILVAAIHDAAALYDPRLASEFTAPMAVALVRDGRISIEAIDYVATFLRTHPEEMDEISDAQASVNELLTAWGMTHTDPDLFEERVEAATNVLVRSVELRVEQRLDPMELDSGIGL